MTQVYTPDSGAYTGLKGIHRTQGHIQDSKGVHRTQGCTQDSMVYIGQRGVHRTRWCTQDGVHRTQKRTQETGLYSVLTGHRGVQRAHGGI